MFRGTRKHALIRCDGRRLRIACVPPFGGTAGLAGLLLLHACEALTLQVAKDRAQPDGSLITAEVIVDLVARHPVLAHVFQGLKELVGQPVAGLVPEDEVRGLLALLPEG